jgi:hypothetical protein
VSGSVVPDILLIPGVVRERLARFFKDHEKVLSTPCEAWGGKSAYDYVRESADQDKAWADVLEMYERGFRWEHGG